MVHLKLLALLLSALLVLAACGAPQPAAAPTPEPAAAAGESQPATGTTVTAAAGELQVDRSKLAQKLYLFNWADYIAPEVLEGFQQEYGVEVVVDVFDTNEDMIAKVRPGNAGYDIVFPSDYAVDIMAKEELLAPLDKALLPNMAHLKPENLDLYYDKGNVYSIPYGLGMTGIAYNKSKVTPAPDSWAALFDVAQLSKYRGAVSMLDDPREVPAAALKYLGRSLNDTDPDALKEVTGLLKAQKPFLSGYDSSNFSRNLASGQVVLAHAYSGTTLQAHMGLASEDQPISGNPDIMFVFPKEGGTIWQVAASILDGSPNKYTAHVFLNYLMRPEIAAKNATFNLDVTPNAAAEKLLDPRIQELYRQGFAPNAEMLKQGEWIVHDPKADVVFNDLFTSLKAE